MDKVKLLNELTKNHSVDPNFTFEEINTILEHYRQEEFNQLTLIIVKQVLKVKSYSLNDNEIIEYLMPIISQRITPKIYDNLKIIEAVVSLYSLLFYLNIEEIYNKKSL